MITILVVLFIFMLLLLLWAFYGNGKSEKITEEDTQAKKLEEEDKPLRRRASDRQIEQEFPDSDVPQYRRKEDLEEIEDIDKVEDDFRLPYSADEIISEGSKHWIYHRTLLNSEIYAKKGDFPTAISLYRGVYERIIDQEINAKIKANVDYLQEYQKLNLQRKTEAMKQKAISKSKKGSEIRLSLDGPLEIPEKIQIALAPPPNQLEDEIASKFDINQIVDKISDKIHERQKEEAEKYNEEISNLKEDINKLIESREKEEDDDEEIESLESEIEELKEKNEELGKLKESLLSMHDKINNLKEDELETKKGLEDIKSQLTPEVEKVEKVEEVDKEPTSTEADFLAKDPPIEEKIPEQEAPEPKKVETAKEEEDEGPEEIEILSQAEKEEELSGMSDEDIFEKILKEDAKAKKDDDFEIIGYNKEEEDESYEYTDPEREQKEQEEENFYRKFLRHGKRVRKELPILKVSYDFSKLPDQFSLSKDQNILQYSFYKYKPMLEKANELIKRRNVRDAINYYNVVKGQNIPPEFKIMLDKNINELTEYIEKYLTAE